MSCKLKLGNGNNIFSYSINSNLDILSLVLLLSYKDIFMRVILLNYKMYVTIFSMVTHIHIEYITCFYYYRVFVTNVFFFVVVVASL